MLWILKEQVRRETISLLERKPVFLDKETTGLGPTDEVVDVAVVGFDGEGSLNTLVKPKRIIQFDATRVHGITNDMVRWAPSLSEISFSAVRRWLIGFQISNDFLLFLVSQLGSVIIRLLLYKVLDARQIQEFPFIYGDT